MPKVIRKLCRSPIQVHPYFDILDHMPVGKSLNQDRTEYLSQINYNLPRTRSQTKKLLAEQCVSSVRKQVKRESSTRCRTENRTNAKQSISNKQAKPKLTEKSKPSNKLSVASKQAKRLSNKLSVRNKLVKKPSVAKKQVKRKLSEKSSVRNKIAKAPSVANKQVKRKLLGSCNAINKIARKPATVSKRAKRNLPESCRSRSKIARKPSIVSKRAKRNVSESCRSRSKIAKKPSIVSKRAKRKLPESCRSRSKSDGRSPVRRNQRKQQQSAMRTNSYGNKRLLNSPSSSPMKQLLSVKCRPNNSRTWDEVPVTRSQKRQKRSTSSKSRSNNDSRKMFTSPLGFSFDDLSLNTIETRRSKYIIRPPTRRPVKKRPATSKRQCLSRNPTPTQMVRFISERKQEVSVPGHVTIDSTTPSTARAEVSPVTSVNAHSSSSSLISSCAETTLSQLTVDTESEHNSWISRTARAVSNYLRWRKY